MTNPKLVPHFLPTPNFEGNFYQITSVKTKLNIPASTKFISPSYAKVLLQPGIFYLQLESYKDNRYSDFLAPLYKYAPWDYGTKPQNKAPLSVT